MKTHLLLPTALLLLTHCAASSDPSNPEASGGTAQAGTSGSAGSAGNSTAATGGGSGTAGSGNTAGHSGQAGTGGTSNNAGTAGSSGMAGNAGTSAVGKVPVVNEVSVEGTDWIELYNPYNETIAVGGLRIADFDSATMGPKLPDAVAIPSDATMAPHSFLVIDAGVDSPLAGFQTACPSSGVPNCLQASFKLSSTDGDTVCVVDQDDNVVAQLSVPPNAVAANQTWARLPDSSDYIAPALPTPGATNMALPTSGCGNNAIDNSEVCDGTDLGTETCISLGFATGTLACAADCMSFDDSDCDQGSPDVVINEVTSTMPDRIELYNRGNAAQNLQGWSIIDSDPANTPFVFGPGASLGAGQRIVLTGEGMDFSFGLKGSSPGDSVVLTDDNGDLVDSVTWSNDEATISLCRFPDGAQAFVACAETFGTPNHLP